ncbi:serine/threonine-protein kinase Pkh2p [[Candida] anglica]|uniref:non-specific serine/threonine protein kinase n=1 Tax=[Candida] anglica TaxID=148631 RepID=A0ABP0EPV8_9ASCO
MSHPLHEHITSSPQGNSLSDLANDLDSIYNTYATHTNNGSVETLDSERDQPFHRRQQLHHNHPQQFDSSRLSSIGILDLDNHSNPEENSQSSFDFNPNSLVRPSAVTNSSLNVLYNSSSDDKDVNRSGHENNGSANNTSSYSNIHINDSSYNNSSVEDVHAQPLDEGERTGDESWAAVKKVVNPKDPLNYKILRRSVSDFKFGKSLGEGSYSTVVLATDKHTNIKYAVKILDKRHIIKEKKVKYVNIEKHALNRLTDRMGIISLYFTFQDKSSLYFVLDYASNGELLTLIKKYGTLNEECTRYYGAQLLDGIKYMHDNGVIHRDIKPENILLDSKMRLQITDFGTARLLEKKNKGDSEDYPVDVRAKSFVGTAEYVSPELLESKYCGKPGDIWAFGCIIYQMIAGKPAFKGSNEYQTFQKITKLQYAFSAGFPMVIRDLIKSILVLQPSKRATIQAIQNHYFFESVKWDDFDSIWMSPHPEIGPYKMNAKSMTKVPQISKNNSSASVATVNAGGVKKLAAKKTTNGENGKRMPSGTTGTPTAPSTSSPAGTSATGLNPASVAAFVLNKDLGDDEAVLPSDVRKTPKPSADGRVKSRPAADYIPGTNILRPTVNSKAIRTLTSSSKKSQKETKPKSKIIEVSPITPIELAWSSYLQHEDERIMKIGPVIAHKQSTDVFERRNKGLLIDSPLGFSNKVGGSVRSNNSSLLTQVVNGATGGLRGQHMHNVNESSDQEGEEYAIIDHHHDGSSTTTEEPSTATREKSTMGSIKTSRSSLFKKLLLPHSSEKDDGNDSSSVSSSSSSITHPLDKSKTCTMLITTHGRVLLFLRDDSQTNYKLVTEINIVYPFIQFKEVISTGATSKFSSKVVPSTGVFAIESYSTTFSFEVEKFDVNLWTETLAKAKNNQYERVLAESQAASSTISSTSSGGPSLDAPIAFTSRSAPVSRASKTGTIPARGTQSPSTPSSSSPQSKTKSPEVKHQSMFSNRMSKSVKRKPPPSPVSSSGGLNMSTGLGTQNGTIENGMLHAAQMAVSSNKAAHPQQRPEYKQRSSFSKEDGSRAANIVKNLGQTQAITSLNSKFLSRSQRKK